MYTFFFTWLHAIKNKFLCFRENANTTFARREHVHVTDLAVYRFGLVAKQRTDWKDWEVSCKIRLHSESSCQIFSLSRPRANNLFSFFPKLHKIETVGTATSKTLAHFALIVCAVILCGKEDIETSIHLALEGKHVRLSLCGRETVYTTQHSHLNVSCPVH